MTALLSFEWLKLERWWMPRVVVVLISVLTLGASCVLGANVTERGDLLLPRGWLAALSFSSIFAPFFWPLLGASWAGNEYGWGTIRSVLSRRPNRVEHALAAWPSSSRVSLWESLGCWLPEPLRVCLSLSSAEIRC
jgi:hypothetical protein